VAGPNFQLKSSLDTMKKLSECFGDPHQSFKIVHIAGTNGKGSVSIKTAVALEKSGFKTGLYTSPHLSCFRERI
jgi:dihydrofolate synthase/folylpolyglutamate synthase